MTARILIVDSAFPWSSDIAGDFRAASFDVTIATTAYDGLLLCCRGEADLVVLDAAQTGLDAFEFCSTLKRDASLRHLPVLMTSDQGRPALRLDALGAGVDELLSTPFTTTLMALRMRSLAEFGSLMADWRRLAEVAGEPLDPEPQHPVKVLLMDRDERSCRRIEEILGEYCEVVSVTDHATAGDISLLGDFDVVIQDGASPFRGDSGNPVPPRILLLLDEGAPIPEDCRDRNIDDVLFRPVDRSEVLSRVRLLGRKRDLMARLQGEASPEPLPSPTTPAPEPRRSASFLRTAA
jgi:DNA-binding response OmpR family regulator